MFARDPEHTLKDEIIIVTIRALSPLVSLGAMVLIRLLRKGT